MDGHLHCRDTSPEPTSRDPTMLVNPGDPAVVGLSLMLGVARISESLAEGERDRWDGTRPWRTQSTSARMTAGIRCSIASQTISFRALR